MIVRFRTATQTGHIIHQGSTTAEVMIILHILIEGVPPVEEVVRNPLLDMTGKKDIFMGTAPVHTMIMVDMNKM